MAKLLQKMNLKRLNRTTASILSILLAAGCGTPGLAAGSSAQDESAEAARLFQSGKKSQAIAIEKKLASRKPRAWLPHAMLSYFRWYTGETREAIEEGMSAARLAPKLEAVHSNLGQMALAICDCKTAIPAFEAATKLAPDDVVPWLGLARCYILTERQADAVGLVRNLIERDNQTYDWYSRAGYTCLHIDEPALAVQAFEKASRSARTPDERSESLSDGFLALLRDNQIDSANRLKDKVFRDCQPSDPELYIRAAMRLLPVLAPQKADELLQSAIANLKEAKDADSFFRLGCIFQDKARFVSYDSTKFGAWNSSAETAFRQALKLNPDPAVYHLALAGALLTKPSTEEAIDELKKAHELDHYDPLAPFLLTHGSNAALNFAKVHFKINGLTCGCQISRLRLILKDIKAVAFVAIANVKPYQGYILLDESIMPAQAALAEGARKANSKDEHTKGDPPHVSFEIDSTQPAKTARDAIRMELAEKEGDLLYVTDRRLAFALISPETLAEISRNKARANGTGNGTL